MTADKVSWARFYSSILRVRKTDFDSLTAIEVSQSLSSALIPTCSYDKQIRDTLLCLDRLETTVECSLVVDSLTRVKKWEPTVATVVGLAAIVSNL